jgi:S-adenosylmethionine hydrolase
MVNRPGRPLVTLLTDFQCADEYVAAMKGVLLGRCADATIVDMTHSIAPGDVRRAALVLAAAVPYFPTATIHVAVVDPGVGTDRAALLVDTGERLLVGPDNGLLSIAAGDSTIVYRLDRSEFFVNPVSRTFHGRDVFASVAGYLAAGAVPADVGTPVSEFQRLVMPTVAVAADAVVGEILFADAFGNLVTNIGTADVGDGPHEVDVGGTPVGAIRRTYADAAAGELVALFGGTGRLEIAVCQGSARDRLQACSARGTQVRVRAARRGD